MELTRIYLPKPNPENAYVSYEKQLQPRMDFENAELEKLFYDHEAEIMALVEREITDYVNCDDLCNDDENMFPKRCRLTGEWYLAGVSFSDEDFLSVQTAFLEIWNGEKIDYLGLEVILSFDDYMQEFFVDGVNSASI